MTFAGPNLCVGLLMVISSIFTHGFIPRSMIESVIVPVINKKNKRINDKGNYRAILCLCRLLTKQWSETGGGEVFSLLFFNIYMDNLSSQLNAQYIDCSTGDVVNHMLYVALFAPSANGLQKFLNMCFIYGCSHDIQFNTLKSVVMYNLTLVNLELLGP